MHSFSPNKPAHYTLSHCDEESLAGANVVLRGSWRVAAGARGYDDSWRVAIAGRGNSAFALRFWGAALVPPMPIARIPVFIPKCDRGRAGLLRVMSDPPRIALRSVPRTDRTGLVEKSNKWMFVFGHHFAAIFPRHGDRTC